MSGIQCEQIAKSSGIRCINPAKYRDEDKCLCGIHMPKEKRLDKFLIKNLFRESEGDFNAVPIPNPEPLKIQITGGKYDCLSNSFQSDFVYRGQIWRSVESAYQAMKFYHQVEDVGLSKELYLHIEAILNSEDPSSLGHERFLPISKNWRETRERFMADILSAKFSSNKELITTLLSTGERELEEISHLSPNWNKSIKGRNKIGELLMHIRDKLRTQS